MQQTKQDQPQIYPDVQIGVRPDGSAYYAKDLAAELKEAQDTLDWAENHLFEPDAMERAELSPVAKVFVELHSRNTR